MNFAEWTPTQIDRHLAPLEAQRLDVKRLADYGRWYLQLDLRPAEVARIRAGLEAAEARLASLAATMTPLEAEFDRRGGWERYYTTPNKANAHVHRRTDCTTCREGTRFLWLPEFAAAPPSVVRRQVDPCSTCFKRWT